MVWKSMFLLLVTLFLVGLTVEAYSSCPDGWVPFGHNCYYFSTSTTNWYNAQKYCLGKGASLVCLSNSIEWLFIVKRIRQINTVYGTKDYWIGANDIASEGTWRCANGIPGYLRWYTGEPNNSGNEDCAHLYPNGYMNDRECQNSSSCRFICEKAVFAVEK
uniref:Toxin candidate TRINITY_DN34632_c0_g1_i3.p1 n=1 Tax=Pachycerianthus maua TaxID=2736681 RepID=A0A7G7WYX6_9CNID|nr:toxin candidate TRINITY_DN34632_c0_g1_i3.p1 [Pachycerianthus maua]